MNHLAHAFLAERAGGSIVGNLMGDFVKGRLGAAAPVDPELREGVALHRRIDAFTDDHPAFQRSRERLLPPYRRFAGILVDVFWDHLLAAHWEDFADESLRGFTRRVADLLRRDLETLPPRMQGFVRYLLANDLLFSYRERDGVARALEGISGRLRRANPLATAIGALDAERAGFEADFREFLPEALERFT